MNMELRKSFSDIKSKCVTVEQRKAFNQLMSTFANIDEDSILKFIESNEDMFDKIKEYAKENRIYIDFNISEIKNKINKNKSLAKAKDTYEVDKIINELNKVKSNEIEDLIKILIKYSTETNDYYMLGNIRISLDGKNVSLLPTMLYYDKNKWKIQYPSGDSKKCNFNEAREFIIDLLTNYII